MRLFRQFANRKYGDVQRLNAAWGNSHNYSSFDDVPNYFEWGRHNGWLAERDWRGPVATGKAVDMAMLEDLNEWRSEFRTDFLTKVVNRLRPILGHRPLSVTGLGFGWSGWYPDYTIFPLGRLRRSRASTSLEAPRLPVRRRVAARVPTVCGRM